MTLGRICIHAAAGVKQDEFKWGHWRLQKHGVSCPRPETLTRGAIIGTVNVVDIVDRSDSEWFGGEMGLVLENARMIEPIPAKGALGYFEWVQSGEVEPPLSWMLRYDAVTADSTQPNLFEDLDASFRSVPARPGRKN